MIEGVGDEAGTDSEIDAMHATLLVHPTRIESLNRKIGALKARITKGKTEGHISATPVRSQLMLTAIDGPKGREARFLPVTRERMEEFRSTGRKPEFTTYEWITIEGELPCIPGWTFVARYDFEHGQCITNPMPGQETPATMRKVPAERCDQCRVRHARGRSYLLQNEEGRYTVVGRTCLRDFLGHGSIESIAAVLDLAAGIVGGNWSDEEPGATGMRSVDALPLMHVLDTAAALIRTRGFISRAAAMNAEGPCDSTAGLMAEVLVYGPPANATPKMMAAYRQLVEDSEPTAEDRAMTEAAVAWLAEQSPAGDYMSNLHTLVLENEQGVVASKRLGILASLIGVYQRSLVEAQIERKREQRKAEAEPVVEGRVEIAGTVVSLKVVETGFGITTKMLVEDDRGFRVYGSVPAAIERDIDRGARVTFVATVTRSRDDERFGFFKRPSKATVEAVTSEEE